jgi:serine/threonine protein kinase
MKKATHKHVVGLREVLASRSKIFIVLDLVTGGELFDKIVEQSRFDEPLACKYFWQTLEGVGYCHDQGVCHRDLKPENLLLDSNGDLKISDFGLSTMFGAQCSLHTICGTPNYVAPEVLQMEYGYDGRTADVWSIGVILYVLLAGFLPFNEVRTCYFFCIVEGGGPNKTCVVADLSNLDLTLTICCCLHLVSHA